MLAACRNELRWMRDEREPARQALGTSCSHTHPDQVPEVLAKLVHSGLLASETPKGAVSIRVSTVAAETLFPRLF
jgi:hypothetical protein